MFRSEWAPRNQAVIDRLRALPPVAEFKPTSRIHVLDLAKDGYIKPHVDNLTYV